MRLSKEKTDGEDFFRFEDPFPFPPREPTPIKPCSSHFDGPLGKDKVNTAIIGRVLVFLKSSRGLLPLLGRSGPRGVTLGPIARGSVPPETRHSSA